MPTAQNSKSLMHFAKHLFLVGRVYAERKKAKEDVDNQLQRMRKSIIRMNLAYSDIDRLKEKIWNLISWERKYAKFFRPADKEAEELKNEINSVQQALKNEREEKMRIISDNDEKIGQLTQSLSGIKNEMKHLHMEKAKRQHRLNALEHKIRQKTDGHGHHFS